MSVVAESAAEDAVVVIDSEPLVNANASASVEKKKKKKKRKSNSDEVVGEAIYATNPSMDMALEIPTEEKPKRRKSKQLAAENNVGDGLGASLWLLDSVGSNAALSINADELKDLEEGKWHEGVVCDEEDQVPLLQEKPKKGKNNAWKPWGSKKHNGADESIFLEGREVHDLRKSRPPIHWLGGIFASAYIGFQLISFFYFRYLVYKGYDEPAYHKDALDFVNRWSVSVVDIKSGHIERIFSSFFVHLDLRDFFVNMLSFVLVAAVLLDSLWHSMVFVSLYLFCGFSAMVANGFGGMCYPTFGATGATIGLTVFQLSRAVLLGRINFIISFFCLTLYVGQMVLDPYLYGALAASCAGASAALIFTYRRRKYKRSAKWLLILGFSLLAALIGVIVYLMVWHQSGISSCPLSNTLESILRKAEAAAEASVVGSENVATPVIEAASVIEPVVAATA